jgi:hypothetical protein
VRSDPLPGRRVPKQRRGWCLLSQEPGQAAVELSAVVTARNPKDTAPGRRRQQMGQRLQTLTASKYVQRLGDVAIGRTWLSVRCFHCPRQGRLGTRRLLAKHGPDVALADVLRPLTVNCPFNLHERRAPYVPGLAV